MIEKLSLALKLAGAVCMIFGNVFSYRVDGDWMSLFLIAAWTSLVFAAGALLGRP